MAYHLIPFIAGAVVGGLAVYLGRDERLRKDLRESTGNLSRKARQTAGEVSDKVATNIRQVRESMPGFGRNTESAASEPLAESAAPKRGTTARKRPARSTARTRIKKAVGPENPEDV